MDVNKHERLSNITLRHRLTCEHYPTLGVHLDTEHYT